MNEITTRKELRDELMKVLGRVDGIRCVSMPAMQEIEKHVDEIVDLVSMDKGFGDDKENL